MFLALPFQAVKNNGETIPTVTENKNGGWTSTYMLHFPTSNGELKRIIVRQQHNEEPTVKLASEAQAAAWALRHYNQLGLDKFNKLSAKQLEMAADGETSGATPIAFMTGSIKCAEPVYNGHEKYYGSYTLLYAQINPDAESKIGISSIVKAVMALTKGQVPVNISLKGLSTKTYDSGKISRIVTSYVTGDMVQEYQDNQLEEAGIDLSM